MNEGYLVGEYIIDSSSVHVVTAIKDEYIFYQPVLGSDKKYTASIPIKNLTRSGTRKVMTVKEIEKLMALIKEKTPIANYDSMTAKEDVYKNEPEKTVEVLKYFWRNSSTLNKADVSLMWEILEGLCKEISFVTKKKVATVKDTMVEMLNKHVSI